ncbi:uncharacterized protein LOC113228500 isoform X2 [Hyposmocoma kahamanoa]|uniref:uncharacterized protein LOC113228500 isoform X2 n=1 Tax=Hyposmocoma kahamanoa TaxID=1477025 RepID=UPI000E6D94E6|nr:uncharacterized protein LOC113228500 isoform X2 [Hyposmocoma kahamanoa]
MCRLLLFVGFIQVPWQFSGKGEPVLQALARLDEEIASSEKSHPAARLAVVTAEMDVIQQEIKTFEEVTTSERINKDTYAKTLHQLFISLDLYRRPMLAAENEDFVANVNRKQMRQLELSWLRTRYGELQRERRVLHAQMLRTRSLYTQLQQLLDRIWGSAPRPGTPTEGALTRAGALRDALASKRLGAHGSVCGRLSTTCARSLCRAGRSTRAIRACGSPCRANSTSRARLRVHRRHARPQVPTRDRSLCAIQGSSCTTNQFDSSGAAEQS